MKTDIILAGVGGQGILSIAAVIGHAAVSKNLYLKQSEVHGLGFFIDNGTSAASGAAFAHRTSNDSSV